MIFCNGISGGRNTAMNSERSTPQKNGRRKTVIVFGIVIQPAVEQTRVVRRCCAFSGAVVYVGGPLPLQDCMGKSKHHLVHHCVSRTTLQDLQAGEP